MNLLDILNSLNKEGTDSVNNLIKLVCGTNGRTLYEGKVKDITNLTHKDFWTVVEITRMNEWLGTSMTHLPIYNRPYRIVVV